MSRIRTWEVLVIIPEVLGNISFSFCMKKKKKKKKNLNKKKAVLKKKSHVFICSQVLFH